MEKTLKNLGSVSLFFLILLGGLHLSSTFLIIEGAQNTTLKILSQSLDLPFLLSALLYGSARFSLGMEEAMGKGKPILIVSLILTGLVLSAACFINFAFSDAQFLG